MNENLKTIAKQKRKALVVVFDEPFAPALARRALRLVKSFLHDILLRMELVQEEVFSQLTGVVTFEFFRQLETDLR